MMRLAEDVARGEWIRSAYINVAIKAELKRPHGRPGVYGRIIYKGYLNKLRIRLWTGVIWLSTETSGGLL
jgi:hypothetical protein